MEVPVWWTVGIMDSIFIGFIILMFVTTGLSLWAAVRGMEKSRKQFAVIASDLGLNLVEREGVFGVRPLPEIVGSLHGRDVRIHQYRVGSGKNSQTWSALRIGSVTGTNLSLRMSGQGMGSKIRSVFGAQEIEVEDAAFNRRWFIETNDEDFMGAALHGDILTAVSAVQPDHKHPKGEFRIKDGEASYHEQGALGKPDRMDRIKRAVPAVQQLLDTVVVHADRNLRS